MMNIIKNTFGAVVLITIGFFALLWWGITQLFDPDNDELREKLGNIFWWTCVTVMTLLLLLFIFVFVIVGYSEIVLLTSFIVIGVTLISAVFFLAGDAIDAIFELFNSKGLLERWTSRS